MSPNSADALWKASNAAIVLGEFSSARDSLYKLGEMYGRQAVAIDSNSWHTRFALSQALGRIALTITNPQARLPYAQGVYHNATACLALNPKSAECADVFGSWNTEVMLIDEALRSMAINMLGASELSNASWDSATKYFQQAIVAQPKVALHHLGLARVYAEMDDNVKAKAEYEEVLQLPVTSYNDKQYQAAAQQGLKDLPHG